MSYEKIEYKCPRCGCNEAEVIPTEFGTGLMCINCMEITRKDYISTKNTKNIPKCICCGSTDIKKISGLSKASSVALWGVFAAGRTSKTWHCNNCGTEW